MTLTTLLKLIGYIDKPDNGTIIIGGVDVTNSTNAKMLPTIRRQKIGYIFQDFNLFPILTAKENIIMPRLLDFQKVDEDYLNSLAGLFGISDRLEHLPSELSGMQKQRIAIVRALINRHVIILTDEPARNIYASPTGHHCGCSGTFRRKDMLPLSVRIPT